MRFGASHRVRKSSDFAHLRQEGSRYNCGSFVLIAVRREQGVPAENSVPAENRDSKFEIRNSNQEPGDQETNCVPAENFVPAVPAFPRFAVIASKKLVGNHAVDRNRAKRIFRAIFQQNESAFPRDFDLLVIARKAVLRQPFSKIQAEFLAGTQFLAEKIAKK